jgi:hypothetical protein
MNVVETIIRLLTFRLTSEEITRFDSKHFRAGLLGAWIVGMGRYWDDPGASILQHMGIGSVIYIFALSLFIWLILRPFKVADLKYFTVLTFIGLTSFPAIFYAIPVERFFSIETANSMNVWFLAVVAIWRLALLFFFLKKYTQLSIWNIVTVTLMPICLIISTLTVLNLHRAVFNIMGGMRNPTSHDASYFILILLTGVSMILTIPLLISYAIGINNNRRRQELTDLNG